MSNTQSAFALIWILIGLSTVMTSFLAVQFSVNKIADCVYLQQKHTQELEGTDTLLAYGVKSAVAHFNTIGSSTLSDGPVISYEFNPWSIGTPRSYRGVVQLTREENMIRVTAFLYDDTKLVCKISSIVTQIDEEGKKIFYQMNWTVE